VTPLVFVAWSPATLSLAAPGQDAVRRFVEDLHHHLAYPVDNFGWWRPTGNKLAKLAFGLQMLDVVGARQLFLKSIERCDPVVRARPKKSPFHAMAGRSSATSGKTRAFNPLASEQHAALWREQLDREVFGPLLRALEKCSCPLTKSLRYAHCAASVVL
jgi:hypothetical protein